VTDPRDERKGKKADIEEIRKYVISNIDWKCNVKTLFREKNVSYGSAVKQAILQGLQDFYYTNISFQKLYYCATT
jgi:hypothetical protein